jgi:hypothetical protein
MDFQTLDALRKRHPAWRLLVADSAPFVASFLHRSFVEPNLRTISGQELVAKLDDYLFHLREQLGDGVYPRKASEYLVEWAAEDRGWLRKYYPPDSDEPHFDLSPATEKALAWLASLRQRQFVGTESRLITVFELLRQMAQGTTTDAKTRIAELERRQAEIVAAIERIRAGHVDVMDAAQVRDRFAQMSDTAYALLADFRELEQSFRDLDRAVREKIATWDGNKGALLDEIFGERDAISDSDQGRSFLAFWDFLMSPARQEELSSLLQLVYALPAVRQLEPGPRLLRVHYDWLEAGEVAQRTVARLSEQLRRYLDEKVWMENRLIMQIIRKIEQGALAVRQAPPPGAFNDHDGGTSRRCGGAECLLARAHRAHEGRFARRGCAQGMAGAARPSGTRARSRGAAWLGVDRGRGRSLRLSAPAGCRRALELFGRMNLQLLIVTPLQKIRIIEPHVAGVGFVHTEDGRSSMLRNLTIEEYRK